MLGNWSWKGALKTPRECLGDGSSSDYVLPFRCRPIIPLLIYRSDGFRVNAVPLVNLILVGANVTLVVVRGQLTCEKNCTGGSHFTHVQITAYSFQVIEIGRVIVLVLNTLVRFPVGRLAKSA